MAKETVVSEAYSFKGWTFLEWLKGNLKTIQEVAKVGIPLIISLVAVDDLALQALITGAGKLALDAIHYYIKKKTK